MTSRAPARRREWAWGLAVWVFMAALLVALALYLWLGADGAPAARRRF